MNSSKRLTTTKCSLIDVSSEALVINNKNSGIWKYKDRINPKQDIIIGMSPTNYHSFIICNGTEYHPRFSFNPGKVSIPRRDSIRAGFFIRIEGLDASVMENFEKYLLLLKGKRSRSCHIGVLKALKLGANIEIKGVEKLQLSPHDFLLNIFTHGLIHKGTPLNISFYSIKGKSITSILNEVKYFQRHFKWAYILSDFYYRFIKTFKYEMIQESTL